MDGYKTSKKIDQAITELVQYGLDTGLVAPEDKIFVTNQILEALGLESYEETPGSRGAEELEQILKEITDYAVEKELIADSIVYRDLFDTKIMGKLVPLPSMVSHKFYELYQEGPKKATDYFYKLSQDSDYIRRYRIKKDQKWITETPYGEMEITINLSKPEKDPKAIAAAKNATQSGYPKCQLCKENEGYAGRVNHPARQNHRIIPVRIDGKDWGFQYSPYVYYNEHCIVFNGEHVPMKIERATFAKLLDFGLVHSTVFSSNLLEHRYRKTDGRSFCIRVTPYSRSGSHINEVLWIFADEDVE